MTDSLVVAVLDPEEQLLEEELRGLLPGATVNLDAVEELSTIRQLHHKKDCTL